MSTYFFGLEPKNFHKNTSKWIMFILEQVHQDYNIEKNLLSSLKDYFTSLEKKSIVEIFEILPKKLRKHSEDSYQKALINKKQYKDEPKIAVLEYLCSEILELSGNITFERNYNESKNKFIITNDDFLKAINNDDELNNLIEKTWI